MNSKDTYELWYVGPFEVLIDGDAIFWDGDMSKISIFNEGGYYDCKPIWIAHGVPMADVRKSAIKACLGILDKWALDINSFDCNVER